MIDVLGALTEDRLDLHSSIVLTYSFDLVLYDGLIRRLLRRAGVVNQAVFCDSSKYQDQLSAVSAARQFGRSYSVTPVSQPACFHPKLYLVLGRKGGRLLIGSGNATIGGTLRNAETFGLFEYERGRDAGPHPAFRQCFEFIEQTSEEASDVVRKQLARARSWTPWLDAPTVPDHRTVLISGPNRRSLLDQINETVNRESIQEILVCTSSVDRPLAALRQFAAITKRAKVRCIVQPKEIQIDGQVVRRLGKSVEWHRFVDPYPRRKKRQSDVYAHAKLLILNCGDREVLVYGSANASKQAFLDTNGNTEIVVIFNPWQQGSTAKRLGLAASLKTKGVGKKLSERNWGKDREDKIINYPVSLTAAVPMQNGIRVHVVGNRVPDGTILELFETLGVRSLHSGKIVAGQDGLVFSLRSVPNNLRIAQLKAPTGKALSNPVGLTWPEVATVQSSSGITARSEAAILAMRDGILLGPVLFELLNQFRDFQVVHGRKPPKTKAAADSESDIDRPVEAFYTDALPDDIDPIGWTGDRTDLDLLAALVQPLQGEIPKVKASMEIEDEVDDRILEEEAERREIDAKGGQATGQEKKESPSLTSTEALERASRRLVRRLERAATAVEKALAQRRELTSIPAASLARQVWMAQIAAFLTGREALTSDGDLVLCLDPLDFADYILRICRISRWQGWWSAKPRAKRDFCGAGWGFIESRSFLSLVLPDLCSC